MKSVWTKDPVTGYMTYRDNPTVWYRKAPSGVGYQLMQHGVSVGHYDWLFSLKRMVREDFKHSGCQ